MAFWIHQTTPQQAALHAGRSSEGPEPSTKGAVMAFPIVHAFVQLKVNLQAIDGTCMAFCITCCMPHAPSQQELCV